MNHIHRLITALAFFAMLTISCGEKKKVADPSPSNEELLAALAPKYDLYEEFLEEKRDINGFVHTESCDALLFSALAGTGRLNLTAEVARDEVGAWHRRPLDYPACYPDLSQSTISKDMFLGLFFYIWHKERRDLAEQIFDYGEANGWNMGEGDETRTRLSPGLQATLAEIIARLGGEDKKTYRAFPVIFTDINRGFAAHLDVLHILLRGELFGFVTSENLNIVKSHLSRNDRNGFYAYVYHKFTDGIQTQAISSLMDETLFPADRLPTTADRKEEYLWQREPEKDWEPEAGEPREHPGADFYFLASQLFGYQDSL